MALLALSPTPASAAGGGVKLLRNATSSFDRWVTDSSRAERRWMSRRYWRMRGYAPFFDRALRWAPKTHLYQDLYAIYNSRDRSDGPNLETLREHPDWVLRDAAGRPLFIPFGCSGGSCPQYAADPGHPGWREAWIARAKRRLRRGYAGLFIDDVNLELTVANRAGERVRPIDPRSGRRMTESDWRRYIAGFTREIERALPRRAEIVHNAGQWWAPKGDGLVRRITANADYVELERGFNDGGLVGGRGKFGYLTFLRHIDWIHRRGRYVVLEPHGLERASRMFELASYYLIRARRDSIATDYRSDPDNWWRGWSVRLGRPQGRRFRWRGLLRRDFRHGIALANQPGAPRRSVTLPPRSRWRTLGGKRARRLTLGPREGIVLRG